MTRYASNTSVSENQSRAEIERLLMRYGADEFGYLTRKNDALLGDLLEVLLMAMRSDFRREHRFWLDEGEAESKQGTGTRELEIRTWK